MIFYPPLLKRGITLTPWLILIPRWAKGNRAYLAHELIHVDRQRWEGALTFWYWYLADKRHRKDYEVEAFRAQVRAGSSAAQCAQDLATGYDLGITYSDALDLLKEEVGH